MILGLSTFTALGIIQAANLGISGYNYIHSTYFDWREIDQISSLQVTFPRKNVAKTVVAPKIESITTHSGTIREVTAYNAGDPSQTDSSPCEGAGGNICKALDSGIRVCAANFVPLGTKLNIQGVGICTVLDRMNKRFSNRVDVAMKVTEHDRAHNFGRQNLLVEIVKK